MRKLDQLTGWRFIAAFGVVLCHFSDLLFPHFPEIFLKVTKGMANFVGFFFILSGFILAYNYQTKFLSGKTTIREFLVARFARIYPACFFSLAIALPAFLYVNVRTHAPITSVASYALASLLLIKTWLPFVSWDGVTAWNGPMWSIETEFFFYLCFPFLIRPLSKLNLFRSWVAWGSLAVVMTALSLAYDTALTRDGGEAFKGAFELFHSSPYFCVLEFAFGIVTYNIASQMAPAQIESIKRQMVWAFPMLVVSYIALNVSMPTMSVFHGLPAIVFSLIILGSYTEAGILKALGSATFVYLGEVSYSLYLLHIPVREIFQLSERVIKPLATLEHAAPPVFAALIISASLGLAAACYKYVEAPMRKKIRAALTPAKPE